MITINLLRPHARKGKRIDFVPLAVVGSIVVAASVAVLGIRYTYRYFVPHVTAPQVAVPGSDFAPSSFVKSGIIEEVVHDIHSDPQRLQRRLQPVYTDLSLPEKVNYEALFARTICGMLARIVPEEIGLRTLEIDGFSTIYAVGLGDARAPVSDLFTALRAEKIELLPPPYSFIKSNGSDGYRFAVSCKAAWGIDLSDPYVDLALGFLPDRDGIAIALRTFEKLAKEHGTDVRNPLRRLTAGTEGSLRRFTYEFSATGTFVDFVKFLNALHDARVPCAFRKCILTAETRSRVIITGQVLFTTRG